MEKKLNHWQQLLSRSRRLLITPPSMYGVFLCADTAVWLRFACRLSLHRRNSGNCDRAIVGGARRRRRRCAEHTRAHMSTHMSAHMSEHRRNLQTCLCTHARAACVHMLTAKWDEVDVDGRRWRQQRHAHGTDHKTKNWIAKNKHKHVRRHARGTVQRLWTTTTMTRAYTINKNRRYGGRNLGEQDQRQSQSQTRCASFRRALVHVNVNRTQIHENGAHRAQWSGLWQNRL